MGNEVEEMIQSTITGLIAGGTFALLGVCIVMTYRMVRIVNFALAAIGALGAYVGIVLAGSGWSYLPALAMAMLVGAGTAALCGLVTGAWFARAEVDRRSVVSVALFIGILTLGTHIFGSNPRFIPALLPGDNVKIGGVVITWASILIALGAVGLAAGVQVVLKRTRIGVRLRAMSERPQTAELLGVPAIALTIGVWAFTGAIAALAVLVVAPTRASDFPSMSLLVLPALAGAAIGLLRSTWGAVVGGIGIGLLEGLMGNWSAVSSYQDALPLLIMIAVLVWSQRGQVWDASR
jgi:branched-chain amino acid transport system permease protein